MIAHEAVPPEGKRFYLVVDEDVDLMSIVVAAGHNPEGWKYFGPQFSGQWTLKVKLIRLGYVRDLKEARHKVKAWRCRLVEGQAMEPFRAKFPEPYGRGPVVFGGSRWHDPPGRAHVACLRALGDK